MLVGLVSEPRDRQTNAAEEVEEEEEEGSFGFHVPVERDKPPFLRHTQVGVGLETIQFR